MRLLGQQTVRGSVRIKVGVESNILDQDREAFVPVSWSFTVRGAEEVGAVQSGTLSDMVVHKGKLFAVEKLGESLLDPNWDAPGYPVSGIRIFDVSSPNQPKVGVLFGAHGSVSPVLDPVYATFEVKRPDMILKDGTGRAITVEPFCLHRVIKIRKAEGISLNGVTRDVLMVATAPRVASQGSGIYVPDVQNQQGATTYLTNSTLWAYDITGDAASMDSNGAPKLLMSSSIGKTTTGVSIFGLPSGLGNAGDYLGVIWRGAGLKVLSAPSWRQAFTNDAAAQGITEAQLARLSRKYQGYYPSGGSVVATNDISHQHYVMPNYPWVGHAVISGDDEGKPVGFASLGLNGKLVTIDTKVGSEEAIVAYEGAPMANWDDRVQDLGATVDNERVLRVETLRGTWQGNTGTDQGLLLLVVTDKNLWVLKGVWKANTPFSAVPLAKAKLPDLSADQNNPWTKVDIQTDAGRMLVGVKVKDKGYVFDLKNLKSTDSTLPTLVPIYEFSGAMSWTLSNGFLFANEGTTSISRVVAKNLDGVTITPKLGIPMLVDANLFFAGAFYDYNKSVLGDYNPPPMPQMPEKLVYSLTDMQGKSGGYPTLRHYYPDLGEIHISGVVNLQDPKQFLEATQDGSPWFMEAEAKLYDGDNEVPGALTIEGLNISGNQRTVAGNGTQRSKVFGNGDRAKEELTPSYKDKDGNIAYPTSEQKFAYSPFKFFIKPDVLVRLDQDMRLDFKERYRVVVELKLYKDENQRAHGPAEATLKTFEFAVKFNSNTRLFDVLRGGVWYFDPVVASKDPSDTTQNPFTAEWLKRLVDAKGAPIDFGGIYQTRLSLTPGTLVKKGTKINDIVFGDDMVVNEENSFSWIGLDVVQQLLNDAMPKLRRLIVEGERPTRMAPLAQRFRKVFGESPIDSQGRVYTARAADAQGAFGYSMAHMTNALQAFTKEEAGADRDLNDPLRWAMDPTRRGADVDTEQRPIDCRISPVLNQHLKSGQDYNPGNMLVNYLVAYPRLQRQGTKENGLHPINTMLTRDLVVGPMGISLPAFKDQREAIDAAIQEFNKAPSPYAFTEADKVVVAASGSHLFSALIRQRIITDSGPLYNSGLGILQLGLQNQWLPTPVDAQDPEYIPGASENKHLYLWAEKPKNLAYDTDPAFNKEVKVGIQGFLAKHLGTRRVDVLVNGVQNVPEELEEAANHLQQWIDNMLEGRGNELPESSKRTPVIAVYNASAKRYYGGNDDGDVFDGTDLLRQKRDTADPFSRTSNLDAIKLIGTLKALVDTVWSLTYQVDFYQTNLASTMPRKIWYWPEASAEPELKDLVVDVLTKAPTQGTGSTWKEYLQTVPLAPSVMGQIDQDFPVNPEGKTEDQIRSERYRLYLAQADLFKPSVAAEQTSLRRELEAIKITLHAHSQGAIVAAVAQTRLSTIERTRTLTAKEMAQNMPHSLDVASQIHLVSYGGGANMLDWGPDLHFKSYAHHVNALDAIAFTFGMHDPFQDLLQNIAPAIRAAAIYSNLSPMAAFGIRFVGQGSCVTELMNDPLNPHISKVISGPSKAEVARWANGDHVVIYHDSKAASFIPNLKEHNFVNGYKCTVDQEQEADTYPSRYILLPGDPMDDRWWWRFLNPKVLTGDMGCLYK